MDSEKVETAKLSQPNWFLNETDRCERTLNHMRSIFGTFRTERDTTYAFIEGYLAGIKSMYRRVEEGP